MSISVKFTAVGAAVLALIGCATPSTPPVSQNTVPTPEVVRADRPLERLNVVILRRDRTNFAGPNGAPPDPRLVEFATAFVGSVVKQSSERWESGLSARGVVASIQTKVETRGPVSAMPDQPSVPTLLVTIQPVGAGVIGQQSATTEVEAIAELFDAKGKRWMAVANVHAILNGGFSPPMTEVSRSAASVARMLVANVTVALWADGYLPLGEQDSRRASWNTIQSSVTGPDRVTIVRRAPIPESPFRKVNLVMADGRPDWSGGPTTGVAITDPSLREIGDGIYRDVSAATRARLLDTLKAKGIAVNVIQATLPGAPNAQMQYDPTKLDPAAVTFLVYVLADAQDLSVAERTPGSRGVSVRSRLSVSALQSPDGWRRTVSNREANTRDLDGSSMGNETRVTIEESVARRVNALVRRLQIEGVLIDTK